MRRRNLLPGLAMFITLAAGSITLHGQTDRIDTTQAAAPIPADTTQGGVSTPKLAIVGGITGAGFVAGYFFQTNLWWKGEKSAFHFDWDHDWRYALGSDKYGHFYFPYAITTIYGEALQC